MSKRQQQQRNNRHSEKKLRLRHPAANWLKVTRANGVKKGAIGINLSKIVPSSQDSFFHNYQLHCIQISRDSLFCIVVSIFGANFLSDWLEKDELMLVRKETADTEELAYHFGQRRRISLPRFLSLNSSTAREQKQTPGFSKRSINSPSQCRQPPVCCCEFGAVCRLHPCLLNRWRCCDYAGSLPLLCRESQEENVSVQQAVTNLHNKRKFSAAVIYNILG